MSLGDEILFFLSQHPGNYRDLRSRMLGDPFLEEKLQESARLRKIEADRNRTIRVTLSRLRKKGLVKNEGHLWRLTLAGIRQFKNYSLYRKHTPPIQTTKSDKKIIIAFDIPSDKNKSRYWLRVELVSLGFKLLQKSVWLGPAPLPKEFIEHLKVMDLLPHLKFFEVKKTDIV